MENKPELRVTVDLLIRVWGMDANGHAFFQNAHAIDISSEGAKLSGIEHPLKPGEVIGVQLGEQKARFRVRWVIDAGFLQKVQAGVQMLEGQQCPWRQYLTQPADPGSDAPKAPAQNNRRFVRHRILFPIELRDQRGAGTRMQTNATDISGRGCYVETLMPLPLGTPLDITFWMDSEKVDTNGIVRASDGGVGMGIEFTGLDPQKQERLQALVDKLDVGFAKSGGPKDDS